jgi:CRP-like cAMP-binding protein
MADDSSGEGLRRRLARSSEDTLGKLAQDLLENPLVNGALTRAFEAREKAAQAQEVAMGALNLPSAADIERLTRRLRSLSQRLEGIEDGVDRVDQRLAALGATAGPESRLEAIEARLEAIAADVQALAKAAPAAEKPPRAAAAATPGAPRATARKRPEVTPE